MFLGTLINVLIIVGAASLGSLVQKRIPERITSSVMQLLGLVLTILALVWLVRDSLELQTLTLVARGELFLIGSVVLGGVVGALLDLDGRAARLQDKIAVRFGSSSIQGFFTATFLYTVGAMAILGALRDGIYGDRSILMMKSVLDGVTSFLLASTFGIGVAFAALPVLLYQGGITLVAGTLEPLLTPAFLTYFSQVGDVILVALGLQLLQWKQIKPLNLVPALLGPILLAIFGIL